MKVYTCVDLCMFPLCDGFILSKCRKRKQKDKDLRPKKGNVTYWFSKFVLDCFSFAQVFLAVLAKHLITTILKMTRRIQMSSEKVKKLAELNRTRRLTIKPSRAGLPDHVGQNGTLNCFMR